jgi:hypothetical protein
LDSIMFWATVAICAAFYFNGTARGLQLAGQPDAALATSGIALMLVIPSVVMMLRAVLRMLGR